MRYVEGTPFGSRGGMSVVHTFPADGTYMFQATLVRTVSGELFGNTAIALAEKNELLEISINGERAAVLEVHAGMSDADREGADASRRRRSRSRRGRNGSRRRSCRASTGPVDDLLRRSTRR